MKLEIPADCEVDKIETQDGHIVVTFREKERQLPKSWEEFCKMFPVPFAFRPKCDPLDNMRITTQVNIPSVMADFTEDPEFSDALVALIKLILLRNCYNGDWVPDWSRANCNICYSDWNERFEVGVNVGITEILFFKSEELAEMFLSNFEDILEKLKPLYGIKEGGEE